MPSASIASSPMACRSRTEQPWLGMRQASKLGCAWAQENAKLDCHDDRVVALFFGLQQNVAYGDTVPRSRSLLVECLPLLRACLSADQPVAPLGRGVSEGGARSSGMGVADAMWTEAHRARHEPRLKAAVAACAVEEIAARLERANPPRRGRVAPSGGRGLADRG